MFIVFLIGILSGAALLAAGAYRKTSWPGKSATGLMIGGGMVLVGSLGLLVFSLFVFASGM